MRRRRSRPFFPTHRSLPPSFLPLLTYCHHHHRHHHPVFSYPPSTTTFDFAFSPQKLSPLSPHRAYLRHYPFSLPLFTILVSPVHN